MNKYRLFEINYHLSEFHDRINHCWGNSLSFYCQARSVKEAVKKLFKKQPCAKVYSVQAYHPTVELKYNATQEFLKVEGLI